MVGAFAAAWTVYTGAAGAADVVIVGGVEMPATWTLADTRLVLNGAGVREYGIFRVAVYAAALYLPQRESRADAILDSTAPTVVHLRMLRDVSRQDSAAGWDYYLRANCRPPCVLDEDLLRRFLDLMPESNKGDTQTFIFRDGALEWHRNGVRVGGLQDRRFTAVVLAGWIGPVPTTEALKRDLLRGR